MSKDLKAEQKKLYDFLESYMLRCEIKDLKLYGSLSGKTLNLSTSFDFE
jgi:hypothetical protein